MSTNKDVFPNCQALQHLLAKFGDVFEGWTRSQQRTMGAETGLLLEAWGTRAYKSWIWKNDSQPWTHWATIRIDTGTHQALNHISWGWELLYSCPLRALHPLLQLWIFLLSTWTAFLAPWPMSKLLPFIKLHNSGANEERWKRGIYFYWAWPPLELKIQLIPQVLSNNQGWKSCWEESIIVMSQWRKGPKSLRLLKGTGLCSHMFLFICIPATPWHSERPH